MTVRRCETQVRIMEVIRHDPGIHVGRLARLAGVSWSTCNHHVRRLESQKEVSRHHVSGRWCAYASDAVPSTRFAALGLLRDARNQRIMDAVRAAPGSPQDAIARATNLPANTVGRRIEMLEQAGLLQRQHAGRERQVFPTAVLGSDLSPRLTLLEVA